MHPEVERLDPRHPALIITYGNTQRKVRPLDRDVLMLGRASGCDIQMKSPDVYPVHLLIVRVPEGWRLRDCTGRVGTVLNGKAVQDELLRDGDVVQLSTFSFRFHLPQQRKRPSRQLVPTGRDNVLEPDEPTGDGEARIEHLKQSRKRLAQRALRLRQRLQESQAACTQLQQILEDRDNYIDEQQSEVDALLSDMKARVKQLEQKEADLQVRRQELEQELLTLRQQRLAPPPPSALPAATDETLRRVCIRMRELESYVHYLGRFSPRASRERQRPEGPSPVADAPSSPGPASESPLQQELADLLAVVSNLQAENELMRARLKGWQEDSQVWLNDRQQERSRSAANQEELYQQIRELERQLDRKVLEVERLQTNLHHQDFDQEDQEAYEAELHRFRLDLERERAAFEDQLSLLQLRTQELEQTAREREEQLAQERAQLAQERAELERLREQFRKERGSRENPIGSRLSNVHKIKTEVGENRSPSGQHSTRLPSPSKQSRIG